MTAQFRLPQLPVLAAAALGIAFLGGCASAGADAQRKTGANSILPSTESAVFVTRVGDELTVSWMSRTDASYTVIVKERARKDADWTPLPGYENLPGTGRQMSVTLRVPVDDTRAFNVSVIPRRAPVRPAPR